MTAPTRPVLRYHGGKWRLAPWIISHFPQHRVYTEAFGGAASVLLRKPRASLVEVYNDLDSEIVNLFRVLRSDDAAALRRLLASTPYAREEFELSYAPTTDPVEQARRTVVRSFMGFGSDSATRAQTGFRANGNRQHNHPAKDWTNYPAALDEIVARLAGVVIENRAGADIIRQHDAPTTLHYVDPPYLHETRSRHSSRRSGKGYQHELTFDGHAELARTLRAAQGYVILSGYASEAYDALYAGWERVTRDAMADGGLPRVEVLWINPACSDALKAAA